MSLPKWVIELEELMAKTAGGEEKHGEVERKADRRN